MSAWNASRSPTPKVTGEHGQRQEVLQRSQGEDHTVTHRHRLSQRRYPRDCPPLKVRWFYAVDSPKWKPTSLEQKKDASKPLPPPKKFVPFSYKDSQAVEAAFQKVSDIEMEREEAGYPEPLKKPESRSTKVPVNEDYLFDVDVERRELSPAYWTGPIYQVRRGTWFIQDGSVIKPCEENLATQLEEGYLKVKPWLYEDRQESSSRSSPNSKAAEKDPKTSRFLSDNAGQQPAATPSGEPRNYRLFGAYMNCIATYQDPTTAILANDDLMTRVSTTVYQKLGVVAGTKVVRGFSDSKKQKELSEMKGLDPKRDNASRSETPKPEPSLRQGKPASQIREPDLSQDPGFDAEPNAKDPRSALERQMSSLAGEPQNTEELEEEARRQEEREMEDSREIDDDDRDREIDHLVLVTHGIGQRLGLRLESINFIHDVNVLRKTLKSVYKASPDLQAFNSEFSDKHKNCRVQVLPVCWRHLLDFPYQGVRQNRKELDLTDAGLEDDLYPGLADITLDSVPAVRNLISDLAMDVLLYQSAYCDHISNIVKQECNRILKIFTERNPSFKGSVSLCGHSLGSAILFDILCHERTLPDTPRQGNEIRQDQQFNFQCEELFCLGSPIALFQMLKGKTISGRSYLRDEVSKGPFASKHEQRRSTDTAYSSMSAATNDNHNAIVSSPSCRQLFNIFHPSDPVSYRLEPLISPAMSSLRPQPLPSVKKSLWTSSGQSLSIIGSRVGQSVGSLWNNFTTGVASSLLNRSLGLSTEDPVTQSSSNANSPSSQAQTQSLEADSPHKFDHRHPTLIDPSLETLYDKSQRSRAEQIKADSAEDSATRYQDTEDRMKKLRLEDLKVRSLNSNGRVDYSIQEGAFDISLIASIASHLTYWADEDVNHFMLSQMLSRKRR
ncbi:DDHD domain-containing protein [Aspergillus ambiguus]|uniref:DDHD family phospholipase n=1 Tax=Aspergillus ambiguus TaxID=176160 RepID=UPI003CCCDAFB